MNELNSVLQRVFTKEFYRLNAMFFLITILLAFGFMSGTEHKALAAFITSSPVWTLVPGVIWSLYGYKIYSFNNQVFRLKEMNFAHSLSLLPVSTQFSCAVGVTFNQFLPATAYGGFLIVMALQNNMIGSAISVGAILVIIIFALTYLLYRRIGFTYTEANVSLLKRWSDKNFQKSFIQIFIEWVMRSQPGLIITIKIFGGLIIFAVCQLYHYDEYDYRLLAMGCLVSFAVNLSLIFHFVLFENHTFSIMRNLPFAIGRRLSYFLVAMTVLYLPELILLTRNFPQQLPLYKIPEIMLLGFSIFILGYRVLLWKNNALESISGAVFISFIAVIVLILFSVPLLLISLTVFGVALYRLPTSFYEFEMAQEEIKK